MRGGSRSAFSLVEVVLALAVAVFALMSISALLPIGVKSNRVSSEELHAVLLLTALEADLRNTYPTANAGKSRLFNLTLPYAISGGQVVLNSAVTANTLAAGNSIGVNDDDSTVDYSQTRAHYQASVIYETVPGTGSQAPLGARLIVNWPSVKATSPAQLTASAPIDGYVETYVTFAAP